MEPCLEAMMFMPLRSAVLCQDCLAVSNGKNVCPCCGSKSIANIEPWLQRKPEQTETAA